MSKATKKQLSLLAAAGGGLKYTLEVKELGPEFSSLLSSAQKMIFDTIGAWPITGTEQEHFEVAVRAGQIWRNSMTAAKLSSQAGESIATNVALAIHLLTDVYEAATSPGKKALLEPCFVETQAAYDYLDGKGVNWPSIETANEIATLLENAIDEVLAR